MSTRPLRLFISYAHKDERDKDRLRESLAPLVADKLLAGAPWDDRRILAGADWRSQIDEAMAAADVAVFLVSPAFLNSRFCIEHEVPTLLRRHQTDGVLILYVLVKDCLWNKYPFIEGTQLLPQDAFPISKQRGIKSDAYTKVVREIEDALQAHSPRPDLTASTPPAVPTSGLPALLARLPGRTGHLFGRDAELKQLDGWQARHGVLLWVADGGMGKSALTRWWLEHRD